MRNRCMVSSPLLSITTTTAAPAAATACTNCVRVHFIVLQLLFTSLTPSHPSHPRDYHERIYAQQEAGLQMRRSAPLAWTVSKPQSPHQAEDPLCTQHIRRHYFCIFLQNHEMWSPQHSTPTIEGSYGGVTSLQMPKSTPRASGLHGHSESATT